MLESIPQLKDQF